MTPAGIARLKLDEGFRSHAYPDPLSGGEPFTVGYGSTGPGIGPNTVWTEPQAAADLEQRVQANETRLGHDLPWFHDLDPVRQDVLGNIAYNVGVAGLEHWPKTLAHVESGDYASAAYDLLHEGAWNAEVGQRAVRLSKAMQTGSWD